MNNKQRLPTRLERNKLRGAWGKMIDRCYNSGAKDYAWYGGRGITVCDEWRSNFADFARWAVNNGYRVDLKQDLSRIDESKGYAPDNCEYKSHITNLLDRAATHWVAVKLPISVWSRLIGRARSTITTAVNRARKRGLDEGTYIQKIIMQHDMEQYYSAKEQRAALASALCPCCGSQVSHLYRDPNDHTDVTKMRCAVCLCGDLECVEINVAAVEAGVI